MLNSDRAHVGRRPIHIALNELTDNGPGCEERPPLLYMSQSEWQTNYGQNRSGIGFFDSASRPRPDWEIDHCLLSSLLVRQIVVFVEIKLRKQITPFILYIVLILPRKNNDILRNYFSYLGL